MKDTQRDGRFLIVVGLIINSIHRSINCWVLFKAQVIFNRGCLVSYAVSTAPALGLQTSPAENQKEQRGGSNLSTPTGVYSFLWL